MFRDHEDRVEANPGLGEAGNHVDGDGREMESDDYELLPLASCDNSCIPNMIDKRRMFQDVKSDMKRCRTECTSSISTRSNQSGTCNMQDSTVPDTMFHCSYTVATEKGEGGYSTGGSFYRFLLAGTRYLRLFIAQKSVAGGITAR
eukprot:29138-Hanusia_phi.AAC.5